MRHLTLALAIMAIAAAPTWAANNDQQVANQIATALKDSGQLQGYEISVKYAEKTARLEGWVRNQEQRAAAMSIVQRSPMVDRVIDKLEVKSGSASSPPKPTLTPQGNSQPALRPISAQRSAPLMPQPPAQLAQYAQRRAPQGRPVPINYRQQVQGAPPVPAYTQGTGAGVAPAMYDQPTLPPYAWPSYAAYPNYGAVTYPKQYSPTAWPYIGPFYPYPQVPLGWRKVTLEWDDGWWFLDFHDDRAHCCGR